MLFTVHSVCFMNKKSKKKKNFQTFHPNMNFNTKTTTTELKMVFFLFLFLTRNIYRVLNYFYSGALIYLTFFFFLLGATYKQTKYWHVLKYFSFSMSFHNFTTIQ